MPEPLLVATDLIAGYVPEVNILNGCNLTLDEGELIGIIGPNGAGKTSLFNLLSGLYHATRGKIVLGGRDITNEPPYRRTESGLGRTFQISSVFPRLSALENVRLAAEARIGGTMRVWRRAAGLREAVDRARWALGRVGLGPRERVAAGSLSHGDKRKLELAMILARDPRVILLDEPMAGVSVEDVPELVDVIRSVHRDEGKTVLMVEHHIDVVTGVAERIAVMHHGALLAVDTPQNVMANETVQAAYVGESL